MTIFVSMNTLAGIGVFPVEFVTAYIDIKAAEEGFDFFGCLGGFRFYSVANLDQDIV